ncbi:hypothetical protein TSUD_232840 [Trifolium subterraneum]|uniref:Uncharacterized protein n=1 Tax=Trifolium subterraneum TaxID=3900 RepID=A0A2Z6MH35_TRISU|nr:hypothetical protein TSUD_232840 [Trifolium subterraneum]
MKALRLPLIGVMSYELIYTKKGDEWKALMNELAKKCGLSPMEDEELRFVELPMDPLKKGIFKLNYDELQQAMMNSRKGSLNIRMKGLRLQLIGILR